jgi:hypothetical protein
MAHIGFASESTYGSAWQFTNVTGTVTNDRQSIVIHAPHPSDKLSYDQARNIGRRLQRKLGIQGTMFEQETL